MKTQEVYNNPKDTLHSIEWGSATWTENQPEDKQDVSIRNRYNNEFGKFNRPGSSEIPWSDFLLMITESISRNKFSNNEIGAITIAIANFIKEQK